MPVITPINGITKLKDLYIAKSVEALQEKADSSKPAEKYADKIVNDSLEKLRVAALEALHNGDEERAYILFYRFTSHYVKYEQKVSDKKYLQLLRGTDAKNAILQVEKLQKSLEKRYQLLLDIDKNVRKSNEASNNNTALQSKVVAGDTGKATNGCEDDETREKDLVNNNILKCTDLFEFIESEIKNGAASSDAEVLLLDCRPERDFENSHINLKSFLRDKSDRVVLLSVPDEVLKKGLTMSGLSKELSLKPDKMTMLRLRKSVKKLVIFDWTSTELCKAADNNLTSLFNCLWKWDNTADRCKKPPEILKGGYKEWLLTYPQYTTNATAVPPKITSPTSPVVSLSQIKLESVHYNLDYMNEEKPAPPKPVAQIVNGFKPTEPTVFDFESRLTNGPSRNAPGGAKLIPSVDRTTKPPGSPNSVEAVKMLDTRRGSEPAKINMSIEEIRRKKQREADEAMQRSILESADEQLAAMKLDAEQTEAEMLKLRSENEQLKSRRFATGDVFVNGISATDSPAKAEKSILKSKDAGLVNGHVSTPKTQHDTTVSLTNGSSTTSRTRPGDRTMSESKSMLNAGGGGGGLTRSYSSPNIAQLLAEEGDSGQETNKLMKSRSSTNPPIFDRALKPSSGLKSFLTTSAARNRNFSPVYSINQAITGLKNLGNTCFMSAIIQCLSNTQELAFYFTQEKHLNDINRNSKFGSGGQLAEEFGALIKEMWTGQYKNITPKDMKAAVGTHMKDFVGCEQQDSHEFLTMLLDKISNDLNRSTMKNGLFKIPDDMQRHLAMSKFWSHHISSTNSVISEMFDGLSMSSLTCNTCGKESDTFEVFNSISLPIAPGNRCNLLDCLKLYTAPETMSGDAAWDCPTCKCKRNAVKKMVLCRLPKILVIHFKRFSYEGMWRQKLQTFIDFPITDLNLRNFRYTSNDVSTPTYNLYGIVNHYGTMEGGHYIAYCKHPIRSKWYKYDDHDVSELQISDVKTQAAYILFYASNQLTSFSA